jgi:DNA-directed RNA polymerase specialized sigma24 family protein
MEILELLYKKHKDWCDIVESFGVNPDTAEDIVMEMYIKLDKQVKAGTNIMYNETEINYYYVYRALRNLFLDLKKKESLYDVISWADISEKLKADYKSEIIVDYDKLYEKFNKELESLYWYDRKVFEIIDSGESFQNLSDKTTISYYSLYNTYRKVKKHLKSIIK